MTLSAALWVPVWAVVIGLVWLHGRFNAGHLPGLSQILGSSSILLAVGVAALSLARWRLRAEARDLQIGIAVLLFGVLRVGMGDLTGSGFTAQGVSNVLQVAAAIALVVAVGALSGSTLRSVFPVRSRELGTRAVLGTFVVVGVLSIVFAPAIRSVLAGFGGKSLGHTLTITAYLAIAALWAFLAWVFWRTAHHDDRAGDIWVAVMLLGFAQSRLVLALNGRLGPGAVLGSQVFGLTALLLVVAGFSHEMHRGLVHSQTIVHALLQQRRTEEAEREELRHDVRAAFFSIGSALDSLSRNVDTIDRSDLEELTAALRAETARLRALVVDQRREGPERFHVSEVLQPLVTCERAAGQTLDVEVVGDPVAEGSPADTAEVLRNLLDNARVHAPGSIVHVLVERVGSWVEIRVADEGLGVSDGERRAIFRRGHRGSRTIAPGSGLGLYVAASLMRRQRGEIAVDDTPGGGAMFTVRLPVPPAPVIALPTDLGPPIDDRSTAVEESDDHNAG